CVMTGAAPRAAFAAEIPMSQVIPDSGFVSTEGPALPEVYHQMARPILAPRSNPILMRDVLVIWPNRSWPSNVRQTPTSALTEWTPVFLTKPSLQDRMSPLEIPSSV